MSSLTVSWHASFHYFPCILVSFQCPHLTSIYQTCSIHFHSPFPSFPHTSLTGVDSTPCIDCIIRSNVRHGCSIVAPCCNPFSIHSINAFSRNFPSIVHTFSIHPLSLHFPHFVHQHPFISINFASFLSILFPAHSIQPFPMNCSFPFSFPLSGSSRSARAFSCISVSACNSFDFHFVHFQPLLFPCISPSAPCFASSACIASSASSGMMLAMLGV